MLFRSVKIQQEQYAIDLNNIVEEADDLMIKSKLSTNFLEKVDIRKKAEEKLKKAQEMQSKFHEYESKILDEANCAVEEFNKQFEINPFLLIKIVLKF